MAIHNQVLDVAVRIGKRRKDWTFRPDEVVSALPDLNPSTIRTHVTSRCCVNAPKNHPHRWDYFARLSRGVYQVRQEYRPEALVRESAAEYVTDAGGRPKTTFNCVVNHSGTGFHARCLETAVEITAGTLDEVVTKLRDSLADTLTAQETAAMVVTLQERLAARPSLGALVRGINASNRHGETDWGGPTGRESW